MNILNFSDIYPDEDSCRKKFREEREKSGVVCHRCNGKEQYWLQKKQSYECKQCHSRQSLCSGTVMENLKLPILVCGHSSADQYEKFIFLVRTTASIGS